MKPASERREHEDALTRLERRASALELPPRTVQLAQELFLLSTPIPERSEDAVLAASAYTAGLVTGEERAQTGVAEAFDVSRLAIQSRWRDQLELLGLVPPNW